MKALTLAETTTMVQALQEEIRRSKESRYDHRLHAVLLIAQGLTCPEVGRLLGDAPRSVEYWVRHFKNLGLAGLVEGARRGRPRHLNETQLREMQAVLRRTPSEAGLSGTLWDGKTLGIWLARYCGVRLGVRQCQRMLRQFGFRRRKRGAQMDPADSVRQKANRKLPRPRPDVGLDP